MTLFLSSSEAASSDSRCSNPAFGLPAATGLRLSPPWVSAETADYLAVRIARAPGDLRSHLRRIHLHHDLGDRIGVVAAVIDLLLALEDKGLDIKRRVLCEFAPDLDQSGWKPPQGGTSGIDLSPHDPCTRWPGCVLAKPIHGGLRFVIRRGEAPSGE